MTTATDSQNPSHLENSGDAPEHQPSLVEQTLREQRESWREISERVSSISGRELPHESPKRILLFGLGSSLFAARLSAFALIREKSRQRIPVIACSSTRIGIDIVPQRGDWAFAFTHRGGAGPTLQAMELCEKLGAFTVMVCAQGIEAPASARFQLPTVPLEKVEPHTSAVTGAICAVSTLLLGNKAVEEWDALRSIGTPDLELYRRRAGLGPTILIGEWEGEWLAREGALKVMEMARLPIRAFGSEEFFHGPHYTLTPEDRIWHISVPKDPRNDTIAKMKPHYSIGIFGATPLAWIPALVELQWLALAVAINRGVDPDLKAPSES
ncbi:MAG: hypothetical protein H7222_13790 [Methylotenera sp.]|nr:hypothetical protein [Oligoflexia bacterium]